MGFRFHKSLRIGKHTRLNLSKSGIGVSTGVKGFRVGVGPRGVRTTASIPGTGISHTTQRSLKPAKRAHTQVPVIGRDLGNGKIAVEVFGEQIKIQRADKPLELTRSERKKAVKIARAHLKQEARTQRRASRGGCLGACMACIAAAILLLILL